MFEVGGRCLAYHGPMLYEAKILRVWNPSTECVSLLQDGKEISVSMNKKDEFSEEEKGLMTVPEALAGQECYFVHYQGWKSTWDEWIGLNRIHEYNEENLALKQKLLEEAKELKKQQQESKRRKEGAPRRGRPPESGKAPSGRSSSHSGDSGKSGSHAVSGATTAGTTPLPQGSAPKITLHIPVKLKSLLVDDWEYVTKDKKVCKLPSPTFTVEQTLQEYEIGTSSQLESPALQSQLSEYCLGLRLYFERSLPLLLLYRLERLQYEELLQKEKYSNLSVLQIYGPIHLLRLISALPDLMASTTMDAQSCQLIVRQTEHLLEWLVTKMRTLFGDGNEMYVNTSSQYEGVALGL
ncbi:EAF3 (YPR023C) [Zygosaccharomyces parabailii]|uniref:Chromatin modification-related protein EAF3 n=1 Tax=Zygosaccharomyces bailii (strain CLIB 213 / ATCC 58445 / CBS 680 / BCRC 21525 / NBRC 1098 / NCYC 1416 / NRRL Y-2227) TaxID=1333698 RepID=A0A8J2T788_ZYGB2|nr:EAF3 (YPR023C) [Zygosaccharomyces parabailii]CDF90182.1 ZYBA0S06-02586g1_1 [Zygosaccharomyces bailii CLIB 213]